ncbi:RNA polymerase sigma factor [Streptomyces fractus]|uniref:RNA polymerase sigma factor n=1 Tax=Streptomyces fractus TaxID=641806 RepID=UPI003CF91037
MSRNEINDAQILAAQAGDADAMWAVVMGCDAMLRGIVRSVAPNACREDAEDYLQEARAVVIERVRDYESGASAASLTSYLYRAARRAVQEAHIDATCAVSVPASLAIKVRHLLWQHAGDADKVWEELEKEPVATQRVSRESFLAVLDALAESVSFDTPVSQGAGRAAGEGREPLTLADVTPDTSSEITVPSERRDLARWLLTQISHRQALSLRAFYGIGMTRQDDTETCADMGIKATALRQLRFQGTKRARNVADVHGLVA